MTDDTKEKPMKSKVTILTVLFGLLIAACAFTPPFKDAGGKVIENSVASLGEVTLGGVKQWILVRGKNRDNPVLLHLHGGPGGAEMALSHAYRKGLEEHYTVVFWDRRGAGKSFANDCPPESLTLEQHIADTHELTLLLLERFAKKKLFLMGHSYGTLIGVKAVQRRPELYHAYVGASQLVSFLRQEQAAYRFALEEGKQRGEKEAVAELTKLGPPPFKDVMLGLVIVFKWALKFGGVLQGKTDMGAFQTYLMDSPEYSLWDVVRFIRGNSFVLEHYFANQKDVWTLNLIEDAPELKTPVYFLAGRCDRITPLEIVQEYYEKLKAPRKALIVFEKSCHHMELSETDAFVRVMVSRVLKESMGPAAAPKSN